MFKRKLAILCFAMLGFVNSYAVDNSIYIDQSGDSSTISVTQDGAGNVVRGIGGSDNTTRANIYGNSNH